MASLNQKLAWLEANKERPKCINNYHRISLSEFERKILSNDEKFTESFYSGDVYIIEKVLDQSILESFKTGVLNWGKSVPSSYEPMVEGAKDFHQIAEDVPDNKYAIKPVRHSYFFFRWNKNPIPVFQQVDHIWGLIKVLGGFSYDEYVNNTPKDGIVDRAQMAHYPPGAGRIPRHTDPVHNQKSILGLYLSKYGEDFKSGGIYFVDKNDSDILIEPHINRGDAVIAYPTIVHGVARIDPDLKPDWNTGNGRWFLGLYSNDSNQKEKRITSQLK